MKNKSKKQHTFVVLAYKESQYLEQCLKSVLNQEYLSDVVIATSTPNAYIQGLADKYGLEVIVNPHAGKGIGYDFDFARTCIDSPLVTIAHQDDIYEHSYSRKVVDAYHQNPRALIIFSDYYEIKNNEKVYDNTNLKIKRILLKPLKFKNLRNTKFGKRSVLRFGNAICCPAVTFVSANIQLASVFKSDLTCNIDWEGWEKLSLEKGGFVFIPECLMGHLVYEGSTTTAIINSNIRTKEDLIILKKFWPKPIATAINAFYKNAEKSNKI